MDPQRLYDVDGDDLQMLDADDDDDDDDDDEEMILRVASISANGDEAIGGLVAEGIELVGLDGVLQVEDEHCVHGELCVVGTYGTRAATCRSAS